MVLSAAACTHSPRTITGTSVPVVGADISFIDQEEYWAVDFWHQGTKQDPLDILAAAGFNAVRLRVFVDPMARGVYQGYNALRGQPVAFCGLERTLSYARRVRERGMDLLLDFHYSDTWADPANQHKPHSWMNLSLPELHAALYEYTRSSLQSFTDAGIELRWVQIGNEIGGGFLRDKDPATSGDSSNWRQFTDFLKTAARAVREVTPVAKIIVHHEHSGSLAWFKGLSYAGLDYDIIGVSYYPQFGGTLDALEKNLGAMVSELDKDIMVVEYSAQRDAVYRILGALPEGRGLGAFIWEPVNWNDPGAENLFDWQDSPKRGHHSNSRLNFYRQFHR